MEPNPSVFLRAIRREVSSGDLFGAGIASGASNVIMMRSAECLDQLIVRYEGLPAMLRALRPAQFEMLQAIRERLVQNVIPVPAPLAKALDQCATAPAGQPGESDVLLYDQIVVALSEGIRALRTQKYPGAADTDFVDRVCREMCAGAVSVFDEQERCLEQLRNADEAGIAPQATAAEPSAQQLCIYLRHRLPDEKTLEVNNVQRLVGDNSKDIFLFDISGTRDLDGSYVMRREPLYNVNQVSLVEEYELLRHLRAAGILVPQVLLGEGDASFFGGGFIVTRKVSGAARTPEKLGANAKEVMHTLAHFSARIHQVTIPVDLPQFSDAALTTRQRMLARVDRMYERWYAERSEDSVVIESAYSWLRSNIGNLDDTAVLTHGDYNLRNILLDGDRVSAILDWELCRVSHPAEDLSYIRGDVEKIMPWEEYLATYLSHTQHAISDDALRYFDVWVLFWQLVISASVYSGYHLNKHRNFIFASVACVEHRKLLDRTARLLASRPNRTG